MGLITRLAWRNLSKRPGQAVLLLLMLSLATTMVSLGLAINETGHEPWNRLHNSINGFHVHAYAQYHTPEQQALDVWPQPDPENVARVEGMLSDLAGESGVVAASGPWPVLSTDGRVGDVGIEIWVEVRAPRPAAVSQPLVVSGQWLDESDDAVVLEDGLASLLKVTPGDEVTIAGENLRVRGSAMTTSYKRYPLERPAVMWANPATAAKLRSAGALPVGATLELRLARPQDAESFVAAHTPGYQEVDMRGWERIRTRAGDTGLLALLLTFIATLLAGLTVATAAVLVTGRMAAQSRQIGALKAVGVTPGQALRVVLVEYLVVAVTAAAIGIVSGTLLSPLLARNLPNLYGAPAAPPITWQRAAIALAVALAVVVIGSLQPALRGVRHSTLRSLAAGARQPRRRSRIARLAAIAGVPLPVVLGLHSAVRRPVRTIANAAGLALGVAMVVVGLGASEAAQEVLGGSANEEEAALDQYFVAIQIDQMLDIIFAAAAVLVALATLNAVIVAVFAARDNARNHAVLRAVGATPRQTMISFVVAQLVASLFGCAAGIPLGVLLYNLVAGGGEKAPPAIALPGPVYALVAVAVPLLYLLIVIVPAARLARRPAIRALTYE